MSRDRHFVRKRAATDGALDRAAPSRGESAHGESSRGASAGGAPGRRDFELSRARLRIAWREQRREHERRRRCSLRARQRLAPLAARLARGEGARLPHRERATTVGAEATRAIEDSLSDGTTEQLVEALTGFHELELEGERWSAAEVTRLAIRDELGEIRDELEEQGHARALLQVYGVKELCELLGFGPNQSTVVARVTRDVRRRAPAVQAEFCGCLAAGVSLSAIDQVRRLVPVEIDPQAARERISELSRSSSRQLRDAAALLLATRRAGELEGGGGPRGSGRNGRRAGGSVEDAGSTGTCAAASARSTAEEPGAGGQSAHRVEGVGGPASTTIGGQAAGASAAGGASAEGAAGGASCSPDPDPNWGTLAPGYLDRLRQQDPELAAELESAASIARARMRLTMRTDPATFVRLQSALEERATRRELPGPTRTLRPTVDDAAALHGLLADFMTVLHPQRRSRRSPGLPAGMEAAGQDAIVRTLCPDCTVDSREQIDTIVERLRQRGRLRRGKLPEAARQIVFARAGGFCEVPGCSRPLEEIHHLEPQALRKDHDPARLLGVCRLHHHRCIELPEGHPHRLQATGRAPGELVFVFPDGRTVETADAPPSAWQIVRRLRESGEAQGLSRASVASLAFQERGACRLALRRRQSEVKTGDGARPVSPRRASVLGIAEGVWLRRLASAGCSAAAYELTRDADAGGQPTAAGAGRSGEPDGATAPGPQQAGYANLGDLAEGILRMGPTAISEHRTLGRARKRYPRCWETFMVVHDRWKQMLAIARSGIDSMWDELLAYLMPYVTLRTMEDVLDQLRQGEEDPRVSWSISLQEETHQLLRRAVLEVRRAHGGPLSLEQVLEFMLEADQLGMWPEIPDRPYDSENSLGAPTMERRHGCPAYATTTLECARCGVMWQRSHRGELLFLSQERVRELRATAGAPGQPRVWMLPASLDPGRDDVRAEQPLPDVELAALARDGGCRVPGCPHSGVVRANALEAGRAAREQMLRALSILMLAGLLPPGADLRELGTDGLVSLCPDHQRALWRGVLRVKGTTQNQVRFEVDLTRALEPGTRKHLKTRVRSRRHVDMRDLMRRVSLLEGRPPPG